MSSEYADVALLTEQRYEATTADKNDWYFRNILHDDYLLSEALLEYGFTSQRVDWARGDVDWSEFRCAVFRTTWDYYGRYHEFSEWLTNIEKQTILSNDASIIRWNIDKHYLADLQNRGISVVPSRFLETGSELNLSNLLKETGWGEAVFKPCVSGGARHTYRVNFENADHIASLIQPVLAKESFLLQPFVRGIINTGEDTLMVLNGEFTHAVRKVAKPGDFRVQDDHGGTYRTFTPTSEQIQLAEQAISVVEPYPEYARVDMVQDHNGQWSIMELELIEPELWLREHPPAAKNMAKAIAGLIHRNESG